MHTVNVGEAKKKLSQLVDRAAKGEPFVIAKAGKPLVKVVAIDAPTSAKARRLGFLGGQFTIPDDFDRMGEAEIERLFTGKTGGSPGRPKPQSVSGRKENGNVAR